jgi:hypothetical protein
MKIRLARRTLAFTLLSATLGLAVAPGIADAGKPTASGSSSSSSVKLVLLDPTSTVASFGDQVTFSVSTSYATKWVVAKCYQAGRMVYSETRGFYPEYPWGQTFTLGPTGYWTGGAANCTADLITTSRTKQVTLATTSFNVVA